jgi:hypothetical protein
MASEEQYWQQTSRITWLREGDRNTRFFHPNSIQRHQKNHINDLRDRNGQLAITQENMWTIA